MPVVTVMVELVALLIYDSSLQRVLVLAPVLVLLCCCCCCGCGCCLTSER